jgi:hypothetical protein
MILTQPIYIAHRGNTEGKKRELENSPSYIEQAIVAGFEVEIDVWYESGFFLGHDKPQYKVESDYFLNKPLWCHAKNHKALTALLEMGMNVFYHDKDDYTLTSKGYIWAFPGKHLNANTIWNQPEWNYEIDPALIKKASCYGICSDIIKQIKKIRETHDK